jgi:hypothetical protein
MGIREEAGEERKQFFYNIIKHWAVTTFTMFLNAFGNVVATQGC